MGTNARLFWILAGFFYVVAVIYVIWSWLAALTPSAQTQPQVEWVGALAIALSGVLWSLIAFYLGRLHKSQSSELPEDRPDANIDDGQAEQGEFSPWSWWPLILASGAALTFVGVAVQPWISFIGAGILVLALVGWTYEYYRGNFEH